MIDELRLKRGGSARLLECDAQHVALETEQPSPPGSTLELELAGAPLGVKVRSCRKSGESAARFRIEGRWVGLSRAQRDALLSADAPLKPPDPTA